MVANIAEARQVYQQRVGQLALVQDQKAELEATLTLTQKRLDNVIKARAVVQIVAKATQEKIQVYISNLVTTALAGVFPEPYEFELRFVERRNTTEADLIFKKNGGEIDDILSYGGGGVADVANFALIISLWGLNKTRSTFISDEPDKFLHSPALQTRFSEMMKMLCDKLGIQLIIVSDQANIITAADKVIRISCKNGLSKASEND